MATFTTDDGKVCLVEPFVAKGVERRAFFHTGVAWEFYYLRDLNEYGSRARSYGYGTELPSHMRSE